MLIYSYIQVLKDEIVSENQVLLESTHNSVIEVWMELY